MFKLEFTTDNAAFSDDLAGYECGSILRQIAAMVERSGEGSGPVHDSNGNRIGQWSFSVDASQEGGE